MGKSPTASLVTMRRLTAPKNNCIYVHLGGCLSCRAALRLCGRLSRRTNLRLLTCPIFIFIILSFLLFLFFIIFLYFLLVIVISLSFSPFWGLFVFIFRCLLFLTSLKVILVSVALLDDCSRLVLVSLDGSSAAIPHLQALRLCVFIFIVPLSRFLYFSVF